MCVYGASSWRWPITVVPDPCVFIAECVVVVVWSCQQTPICSRWRGKGRKAAVVVALPTLWTAALAWTTTMTTAALTTMAVAVEATIGIDDTTTAAAAVAVAAPAALVRANGGSTTTDE